MLGQDTKIAKNAQNMLAPTPGNKHARPHLMMRNLLEQISVRVLELKAFRFIHCLL